ncbi:hypothetical protein CRM22_003880, partial [Opisthorchis felineus]
NFTPFTCGSIGKNEETELWTTRDILIFLYLSCVLESMFTKSERKCSDKGN